MKDYLSILGFLVDDLQEFPKMKEIRAQFLKLALIKHPDKPNGSEKEMKELLKAYKLVGKHIEEMGSEVKDDPEEHEARRNFKDFNFENINKQSISISILTIHAAAWEIILETNYGKPVDKSDKGNGKKYTVVSYVDPNQCSGTVYITIWNKPKQLRSTILIQAENCNMQMNMDFLYRKIPELFEDVLKVRILDDDNHSISYVEKGPAKPLVKCEKCKYKSTLMQMKMHMKAVHGNKPVKASKRLRNTPLSKSAKRPKSDDL